MICEICQGINYVFTPIFEYIQLYSQAGGGGGSRTHVSDPRFTGSPTIRDAPYPTYRAALSTRTWPETSSSSFSYSYALLSNVSR
jgi:hypothetical protein